MTWQATFAWPCTKEREKLRLAAAQHLQAETHVVAPGDTLNLIGSVYGVDVQTIQQANGLHPDSVLYPGARLRVPSPLHAMTHQERTTTSITIIIPATPFPIPDTRFIILKSALVC